MVQENKSFIKINPQANIPGNGSESVLALTGAKTLEE
jgi:hypothetical protein